MTHRPSEVPTPRVWAESLWNQYIRLSAIASDYRIRLRASATGDWNRPKLSTALPASCRWAATLFSQAEEYDWNYRRMTKRYSTHSTPYRQGEFLWTVHDRYCPSGQPQDLCSGHHSLLRRTINRESDSMHTAKEWCFSTDGRHGYCIRKPQNNSRPYASVSGARRSPPPSGWDSRHCPYRL